MKDYAVELTDNDRMILENYKVLMEGLADYFGDGYEFVLHSLEDLDHAVIKIINGHHTGRKEGSPLTDLGMYMLGQITENNAGPYISYFNDNKDGKSLKSCTISIYGDYGKIIGMFCINFYLDTPFSHIIENFIPHKESIINHKPPVAENFAENTDDLIEDALKKAREQIYNDHSISSVNKNKEIIALLYERGIFNFKDSVVKIAGILGISKNTVYMHIRNIHGKKV